MTRESVRSSGKRGGLAKRTWLIPGSNLGILGPVFRVIYFSSSIVFSAATYASVSASASSGHVNTPCLVDDILRGGAG